MYVCLCVCVCMCVCVTCECVCTHGGTVVAEGEGNGKPHPLSATTMALMVEESIEQSLGSLVCLRIFCSEEGGREGGREV